MRLRRRRQVKKGSSTLKIFCHSDSDGRAAAAVVLMATYTRESIECIEMDYARPVPFEKMLKDEEVVLVDFSFKPDDMKRMLEITKDVTWIDHHATAKDYFYQNLKGLRDFSTKGLSGCELAWQYYCSEREMPHALKLIGDYDSWRMQLRPKCLEFYEGLKMRYTDPLDQLWRDLLDRGVGVEGPMRLINDICAEGRSAIRYRDMYCADMCSTFGFETTFEGLSTYVANIYKFGSQGFGKLMKKYDMCAACVFDGKLWTISLYTERPDLNVGAVAAKYKGGGHRGAAGWTSANFPFVRP